MIDLALQIAIGTGDVGDVADVYTNMSADGRCSGDVNDEEFASEPLWAAGDDPSSRNGRQDPASWLTEGWLDEAWLSDLVVTVSIVGAYFGLLKVSVVGRDPAGNQATAETAEVWINSGPDPVSDLREISPDAGRVSLRYLQPAQLLPGG